MTKKLFFIAAILSLATFASAQDRISLGLKTGFNSTKMNLSNVPSGSDIKSEAKGGFLFGAYGKLRLIGNLSIQPELYYAKKTTQMAISEGDVQYPNSDNTFHTWDVPILANLQLLDLEVVKVYGIAGHVASFIANTTTDLPEWDEFKSTNWTLQAGGGIEVWRLTADVRYEWGLSDISDLTSLDIGQKTNVLTFSIGYKLFGI